MTYNPSAAGPPEGTAVKSTGETGGVKFLREDGDDTSSWQIVPGSGPPEGTAVLSTGETGGTKFLREDGDGTSSWQPTPSPPAETNNLETVCTGILANEIPVGSGPDAATYTGSTGSGNVVRATSPELVTPVLGTPSSGTLTACKMRRFWSGSFENPTASENRALFFVDRAVTVAQVRAVLKGTGSPSLTYQLKHSTDRSAAGNNLTTSAAVTSTTIGTDASLSDATIPADSWVWIVTTASGGTETEVALFVEFTED